MGFRWVMEAKRRGATIIHVDPRFTRTSAMADVHVPIRAGTDVAFLGGIVNHILVNDRWFRDYVLAYTNAAAIVDPSFQDTEDLDGLFSGWNRDKGLYEIDSWQYRGASVQPAVAQRESFSAEPKSQRGTQAEEFERDETLQDPNCVFQILKRHFSRYTPEMVEQACGIPPDLFLKVAEALCENSGPERTSAFAYAVGWTQHSIGVQYIRTASIIQLLLGTSGGPAEASWRFGGTPRSRVRPTSPPSTTCSRAICRCPGPAPTSRSRSTSPITRQNAAGGARCRSTWSPC